MPVFRRKQKSTLMLMKLLAEEKIELAYDTKTVYKRIEKIKLTL